MREEEESAYRKDEREITKRKKKTREITQMHNLGVHIMSCESNLTR